jgi:hypothetical protein
MSTAVMTERMAETSPRFEASGLRAQIAGAIYLLSLLGAALAEILVRGGLNVAGGLIVTLAMIAVTLLFYDILSPLNRRLLLVAASFNLVGLAFEVLRMQPRGANIAVVFDGFFCILVGCLAFRSSFLPRILGALMALGGLGWLTLVSPLLANYLAPYDLAFGLLGEGAVCLWVLSTGVNVGRGTRALRKPTYIGAEAAAQHSIR